MIYYDPLFTANQQHWKTLGIPFVAQSTATNYVVLSSIGDFVIDYQVDDVKTIPTVYAGGTFDPVLEAEKKKQHDKEHDLQEQDRAEAQSLRDGGRPKIEVRSVSDDESVKETIKTPPREPDSEGSIPLPEKKEEIMGNDLTKDPILI